MGKISREDAFTLWLMGTEASSPQQILQRFGSAEAAFRAGVSGASKESLAKIVNRVEQGLNSGMEFISYKNPKFPSRLLPIPDAPLGIFVYGTLPSENTPAVAIVGSRGNTHYGGQVARRLGKELASLGIVVVSGMARGLDAQAHEGALAANGETVAVLACGVDNCYPAENFQLYRRIRATGCVISEYLPQEKPQRWCFPARNRIITAMADVLVVAEAGVRSGTATTVNHALDQGKEVFAVPGRIYDSQSIGTNELIKQGAHVLTSHLDLLPILKEQRHLAEFFKSAQLPQLGQQQEDLSRVEKLSLASDEAFVYSCISHEAVTADYIAYKTGLNIAGLNKILLEMELAGHIKKLPGQKFIRA